MWYDNFITAKRLLVDIIETLVTIADVEVVYNPSNHTYSVWLYAVGLYPELVQEL